MLCKILLAILGITLVLSAAELVPAPPRFSFGLVADIQSADADSSIGRDYRGSAAKLNRCADWWNQMPISFVIQLGDFVDRGPMKNLDDIAQVFNRVRAPKYHVLGNHDFFTARDAVIRRLGMPAAYYEFSKDNWRFVVLDGMNVSVNGGWPETDAHAILGRHLLQELTASKAINARPWNGAAGEEQREWLKHVLADAAGQHQRALVFCHMPALPASCRPVHLMWDHAEIVRTLESSPSVKAFFNGHDHKGGYGHSNNIHYVTFPALVEHGPEEACNIVEVYSNRLVIQSLAGARQVLEMDVNASADSNSPRSRTSDAR